MPLQDANHVLGVLGGVVLDKSGSDMPSTSSHES
jgi:hypothetical protein